MLEIIANIIFVICFFIAFFGIEWVEAIIDFFINIFNWIKNFF